MAKKLRKTLDRPSTKTKFIVFLKSLAMSIGIVTLLLVGACAVILLCGWIIKLIGSGWVIAMLVIILLGIITKWVYSDLIQWV